LLFLSNFEMRPRKAASTGRRKCRKETEGAGAHLNFWATGLEVFGSEGTIENSPAVHCRVESHGEPSPQGTTEIDKISPTLIAGGNQTGIFFTNEFDGRRVDL